MMVHESTLPAKPSLHAEAPVQGTWPSNQQGNEANEVVAKLRHAAAMAHDEGPHVSLISFLLEAKDHDAAAHAASEALQSFPNSTRLFSRLAQAEERRGNSERALSVLKAGAQRIAPDAKEPGAEVLFRDLLRLMPSDAALKLAVTQRALCAVPASPWLHVAQSEALAKLGRIHEAVSAARKAVELGPKLPQTHHQLLLLLGRLGEPVALGEATTAAVASCPDAAGLCHAHSKWLSTTGRRDEALEWAERAATLEPTKTFIWENLIALLTAERRYDDALEKGNLALRQCNSRLNLDVLNQALKFAGNKVLTRQLVDELTRLPPQFRLTATLHKFKAAQAKQIDTGPFRTLVCPGHVHPPHLLELLKDTGHPLEGSLTRSGAVPGLELLELHDVLLHVIEGGFHVLTSDGQAAYDVLTPYLTQAYLDRIEIPCEVQRFDQLFFAGDFLGANNFCLWLCNNVPRIALAQERFPGMRIGIPGLAWKRFQVDSLKWLHLEQESIFGLNEGFYRVGRLLLLNNSGQDYRHILHNANPGYAALLLDRIPRPAKPGHRRLWLTREPGLGRSLSNHAQIMDVVREMGFEAVDPGTLPFAEQAKLLSEASHVAAPHGAAMTNLLFSAAGTPVLEIFPPKTGSIAFALVSEAKKLRYRCIVGETVGERALLARDLNRQNFSLKPEALRAELKTLLDS